jgi:hypothetical protein
MAKKKLDKSVEKPPVELAVSIDDLLKMQRLPSIIATAGVIAICGLFHDIRQIFNVIFNWEELIPLLAAYFVSLFLHEVIHRVGFMVFGSLGSKDVKTIFHGAMMITHPRDTANVGPFRLATALPLVLMGVIPAILGIALAVGWVMLYGALMVGSAMPDMLILWRLRSTPAKDRILFHKDRLGYEILPAD